jgi:ABC-type transport system involved in multi-copper enzyme maturation permease subunit
MRNIRWILAKEWIEFRRDRFLLPAWIAGAAVLAGFAVALTAYAGSSEAAARDILQGNRTFLDFVAGRPGPVAQALDLVVNYLVPMVAAFVSLAAGLFGGASAVVGEREGRTLEILLTQPVRESEILLGKVLAVTGAGLAGVLGAQAAFLLLGAARVNAAVPGGWIVPSGRWAALMLLEMPLLTALGALVATLISVKVESSRAAFAVVGLVSIALVSLASPAILVSLAGAGPLAAVLAGLAAVDAALFALAVRVFDRERLLLGKV